MLNFEVLQRLILFVFLLLSIFDNHSKFLLGLLRHLIVNNIGIIGDLQLELLLLPFVLLYYKVDVIVLHEVSILGFATFANNGFRGLLPPFFFRLGTTHKYR